MFWREEGENKTGRKTTKGGEKEELCIFASLNEGGENLLEKQG